MKWCSTSVEWGRPSRNPEMEELFDVVDASDRVLRRESRFEVHRQELLHRAVHLFVFNEQGELFLQKRSMLKDTAPGKWSTSCAGHVDAGEDYDTAVVREAFEELGLPLEQVPEEVASVAAVPETGQEFLRIYRLIAEGPFRMPVAEIEEGAWWPLPKLEKDLRAEPERFAGSFRYLWNLLCHQGVFKST